MGIHIELYNKTKNYLTTLEERQKAALQELNEAKGFGDLSENSEFDAAKANLMYLLKEIDKCRSVLNQPILKSHSTDIIEEGCIISLKMYGPYNVPQLEKNNKSLEKMTLGVSSDTNSNPSTYLQHIIETYPLTLEGVFLFGGSADFHNIVDDNVLDILPPIGSAILGKNSGVFEISIPAGFCTIIVQKLHDKTVSDTGYELY